LKHELLKAVLWMTVFFFVALNHLLRKDFA